MILFSKRTFLGILIYYFILIYYLHFIIGQTFTSNADPPVQIDEEDDEVCLLCWGDQFLRKKCLYLERSAIGCKKSQRLHPEPFSKIFRFLIPFTTGKTFTSNGRPSCPNRFIWTVKNFLFAFVEFLTRPGSVMFSNFLRS